MKKKIREIIKKKTNKIHWFFVGAIAYLLYKEIFLDRPWDIIDLMATPFFGMIGGVVFYRWFTKQ